MALILYNTPFIPLLPGWAAQQLSTFCDEIGISSVTISSTVRSVESQAQAMYDNLVAGKVVNYGSPGRSVLAVGKALIAEGVAPSTIVQAMTDQINAVGPANVSHHLDPSLAVADIMPSKMSPDERARFAAHLSSKHSSGVVGEFLYPQELGAPPGMRDPAFHVQFLEDQSSAGRLVQAAENLTSSAGAAVEDTTGVPRWMLKGALLGVSLWLLLD